MKRFLLRWTDKSSTSVLSKISTKRDILDTAKRLKEDNDVTFILLYEEIRNEENEPILLVSDFIRNEENKDTPGFYSIRYMNTKSKQIKTKEGDFNNIKEIASNLEKDVDNTVIVDYFRAVKIVKDEM